MLRAPPHRGGPGWRASRSTALRGCAGRTPPARVPAPAQRDGRRRSHERGFDLHRPRHEQRLAQRRSKSEPSSKRLERTRSGGVLVYYNQPSGPSATITRSDPSDWPQTARAVTGSAGTSGMASATAAHAPSPAAPASEAPPARCPPSIARPQAPDAPAPAPRTSVPLLSADLLVDGGCRHRPGLDDVDVNHCDRVPSVEPPLTVLRAYTRAREPDGRSFTARTIPRAAPLGPGCRPVTLCPRCRAAPSGAPDDATARQVTVTAGSPRPVRRD
jgi:hypothetical protein